MKGHGVTTSTNTMPHYKLDIVISCIQSFGLEGGGRRSIMGSLRLTGFILYGA